MQNSQPMVKLLLPAVIRPFPITPVDFISYQTANGCTADGGGSGVSKDVASHPTDGCAAQNASVALGKPRAGTASQRCDRYRSSQNESAHFNLLDGKPLWRSFAERRCKAPPALEARGDVRDVGVQVVHCSTSTLNEPL